MSDKVKELCAQIESPGTFALLAIANDVSQFVRFAGGISYVKDIIWELQERRRDLIVTPSVGEFYIAGRIGAFLSAEYDRAYANPYDSSIAIYLYILKEVRSEYLIGISALIQGCPENLFWARKIARDHIFV